MSLDRTTDLRMEKVNAIDIDIVAGASNDVIDDELAFPAVFLASLRIGAIPVPVSTMLRPEELGVLADDSAAKVVVLSARHVGCLESLRAASAALATASGAGRSRALSMDVVRRPRRSSGSPDHSRHTGTLALHLRNDGETQGSDPPTR